MTKKTRKNRGGDECNKIDCNKLPNNYNSSNDKNLKNQCIESKGDIGKLIEIINSKTGNSFIPNVVGTESDGLRLKYVNIVKTPEYCIDNDNTSQSSVIISNTNSNANNTSSNTNNNTNNMSSNNNPNSNANNTNSNANNTNSNANNTNRNTNNTNRNTNSTELCKKNDVFIDVNNTTDYVVLSDTINKYCNCTTNKTPLKINYTKANEYLNNLIIKTKTKTNNGEPCVKFIQKSSGGTRRRRRKTQKNKKRKTNKK